MARGVKDSVVREHSHLIGTDTDERIANLCGVSRERVWQIREELGIPRFSRSLKVANYAATHGARAASEYFGISLHAVHCAASQNRMYVKRISRSSAIRSDPELGVVSDHVLAERHGASIKLVQDVRYAKQRSQRR